MDCQTRCLIDCNKGHYYTAGNCLECPVGFYCPGGRAAPRKCPVGTANRLTAQADITACQACPDGYISSETRAGCRLCPDGYLCDPHSGLQKSCNPGQYSPEGELECWECPQGYICPDGRNRQHCSAGQEPNPSRTHCVTCTLGSFSTKEALGCQPCPAGHYCPHIGTIQPLPCPPGSCTDAPGQSDCQRCNESSCCLDTVGQIQQDREPVESPEGLQCHACPSGHLCSDGFTAPPCLAGSFEPREQFCKPSDGSSCLPDMKAPRKGG
ncbi:signal peptide, CUB and EGF-like domain-containing protein 2 isoform X1 [Mauremys reevesii]|uniref:signal peptide, CUB and EGF-like domain-containing protein 2 isoform X1 n=1 Tax=Mauremys reevesii TaxID=260615 RepID=UPI00193EF3FB|nr:signal peptide, CUB and EGF-like domain-containing protein 2 isoform X1 [Mauremys reevesii]